MPTFADYAFYVEKGGKLSESVYNSVVNEAYAEIIFQTNGAALRAGTEMLENVKMCECALVDIIAAYRESNNMIPKGATGITNDGYSVSFGNESTNKKAEMQERRYICKRYLQYPENLMCRWI
ncbi:MAG: hypothetical protein GX222_08935 [Ruminococcaceae bacterium]|nr:hypothetical protein [Oscillospiraceae bacterium]